MLYNITQHDMLYNITYVMCGKSFHIYNIFLFLFFLNYRTLSRKSQKSSQPARGTRGIPYPNCHCCWKCLNLNILLLKRRYLKLINYDSRTAEQCKCEVSIRRFKLISFSLLSLFFLVFSFVGVIFGHSEKRTILA